MRLLVIGLGLSIGIVILGCGQVSERTSRQTPNPNTVVNSTKQDASSTSTGQIERRVVFHAHLSLEVVDFDPWAREMSEKVESLGGYVSQHREQRYSHGQRIASWILRVPSGQFPNLIEWLNETTTVTSRKVTSQDRTEEFVDLQARIASKQETLRRMMELFAARSQSLPDLLAGEKEIDRVGQELERLEGQFKLLEEQTAMSTVELQVSTPLAPQTVASLSFFQRWTKAMSISWQTLVQVGQSMIIAVSASLPWILCVAAMGLIGKGIYRYWRVARSREEKVESRL